MGTRKVHVGEVQSQRDCLQQSKDKEDSETTDKSKKITHGQKYEKAIAITRLLKKVVRIRFASGTGSGRGF